MAIDDRPSGLKIVLGTIRRHCDLQFDLLISWIKDVVEKLFAWLLNYSMVVSDDHHVILLVPTICRLALLEVYIYLQRFRDFSFFRQF